MNSMENWEEGVIFSVTVCDAGGKILKMNEKARATFIKSGGKDLIGKNLLDCHPEPAKSKLKKMLETPYTRAYTIEKKGIKKLIYQTPWFKAGRPAGLVELSLELPAELPHYIRK